MGRLVIENVQVGYEQQTIVQNLTIQIPNGKITTIIGANGCGKSTLLKAMTRIIPYKKGSILLDGEEIYLTNTKELAKKMAILPQTQDSGAGLLVEELVSYGRFPYQKGFGQLTKEDREIINWALDVTNTAAFREKAVDELSGGQRQRVWIAMALVQDTEIIFLDEPTTYLDLAHQLEILTLLQKLNETEKRTIVMVLHDLNHAARFSDFMVALSKGNLICSGTPEEVMTENVLKEVFNIDAYIGVDPRTSKPICLTYDLI
ncbi:ABC transporter ATP-binding protein [Solibacillus sp. FSL H8-0538]|uniref:ABC transporter ATP-binding protein n=1 Tax=Solibacillus sp. FSL H8-0538 TaxID=2921400 RepID=UPI0030F754BD